MGFEESSDKADAAVIVRKNTIAITDEPLRSR